MKKQKPKVSREAQTKIDQYREYFAGEMDTIAQHLQEFKETKEEFYRRWSAYSDFRKVQELLH